MNTEYALSSGTARALSKWQPAGAAWRRFARRVRAMARLAGRRRRARRNDEDLRHLDERTLRDLGLTRAEIPSVVAELAGRAGATRQRTDPHDWHSTSSRFRLRVIDPSL